MPHANKQMISFFLTTKCNLVCTYCYNEDDRKALQMKGEEISLPLEIAKAGINMYFDKDNPQNFNPTSSRHIRFYGPGEPSCEFNLMRDIFNYARLVGGDKVTAEIQTNGVFHEDIREWCLDNLNNIWMSFDGLPECHNKQRPLNPFYKENFGNRESAQIVEENTKYLIGNKGNRPLMVGARVTITNDNSRKQCEMVDYFHSLGVRYVWTNPIFPSVGKIPFKDDEKKQAEYEFDMEAYVEHYVRAYEYAKSKGMQWGSFLIINFDGECNYHCRTCTPVPHITPDGYLTACDLVTIGKEAHHMDIFVYGKWDADTNKFVINDDKVAALQNRRVENMPHCQDCLAKNHCAGYCLGEVLNETGCLYGRKAMACYGVKSLFKKLGNLPKFDYFHP